MNDQGNADRRICPPKARDSARVITEDGTPQFRQAASDLSAPLPDAAVPRTTRYVDHPPTVSGAVAVNRGAEGI